MAEFQWWLLLVGLVAGGGLVAVVFLDGARREQDVDEAELPAEAQWIAARLGSGERRLGRRSKAVEKTTSDSVEKTCRVAWTARITRSRSRVSRARILRR